MHKTQHILYWVNSIYISYWSYKRDLVKSNERFSLICCLHNLNDRQQEYCTAVTLRAAKIQYTVSRVFFLSCLLFTITVFTRILAKIGILTRTSVKNNSVQCSCALWAASSCARACLNVHMPSLRQRVHIAKLDLFGNQNKVHCQTAMQYIFLMRVPLFFLNLEQKTA